MGSSALLLAKRALVVVIRSLAATYDVVVACNRDSPDKVVLSSFRKVALKVHPDHGGATAHQQQLNEAREAWDQARNRQSAAKVEIERGEIERGVGSTRGVLATPAAFRISLPVPGDAVSKSPLRRSESSCQPPRREFWIALRIVWGAALPPFPP